METKKGMPIQGYALIFIEPGSGQLIHQIRLEEIPYNTSVNMAVVGVLVGDIKDLLYEAQSYMVRNKVRSKDLPTLNESQVRERLQPPKLEEQIPIK